MQGTWNTSGHEQCWIYSPVITTLHGEQSDRMCSITDPYSTMLETHAGQSVVLIE